MCSERQHNINTAFKPAVEDCEEHVGIASADEPCAERHNSVIGELFELCRGERET
jgi:hypothetical protein